MERLAILLVVALAVWAGSASISRGAIKSYKDISVPEMLALQQSETRLITYDRALQALEKARKNKKISRQEYAYEEHDLNAFIYAEAKYQNDLLTKESGFAEDAREVMQNIAKYSILVPGYILAMVAKGLAGSSYTFSP